MLALIYRQFHFQPIRTILTVLAIAAVTAEILVLEGFLAGLYHQLRTAVLNRGGDLIMTQAGISNFIATRSILPQVSRLQAEAVDGVKEAHPLTAISAIYERDGRRTPIILMVYDTLGGPASIVEAETAPVVRGIIIDRSIAVKHGLSLGDKMEISEFEFTVSGISSNSSSFLTPFAFIAYDDLIDFYFESDIAADIATFPLLSFLLVEAEPGADVSSVAARLEERIKTADVFLPQELAQQDENLGRQMMGPILGLLLAVSYGIGVLVVGMFMFAAVRARLRSFGVMKALGFGMGFLTGAVVLEAIILALLGLPVGIALAHGIAGSIETAAPIYVVLINEPAAVARTAVACAAFAALGAFIPVRAIARIDPAVVFRS